MDRGGQEGQSEKRPVVFTRNQFVLLRGNIGWGKKKVLLMKTTAEYEKSRFKQARNNTLVSGTLEITIRIIYISD